MIGRGGAQCESQALEELFLNLTAHLGALTMLCCCFVVAVFVGVGVFVVAVSH